MMKMMMMMMMMVMMMVTMMMLTAVGVCAISCGWKACRGLRHTTPSTIPIILIIVVFTFISSDMTAALIVIVVN